jgi:hypothetical protein
MRQPKIYISLPSNGAYWPEGSIDYPENGQLAVFSMTAKDELMFKTPDALLNGQAVVDVIQSCVPAIKNAWDTPNVDVDTLLIAIRLATYGEMMDITHRVPNTDEDVTHQIDLRILLDELGSSAPWQEAVQINDMLTCFIRPLTYKHLTNTSLKTFETQRLLQAAAANDLSEEQKMAIYNQSLNSMSNITLDLVVDSIKAIEIPGTVVKDREFIREFLDNADKDVYQKIQEHIAKMREANTLKPVTVNSTDEQIEEGAPVSYLLPITMDNSDFFGQRS